MIIKFIKAGAVAAIAALAMPIAAEAADMKLPVYKGMPRSVISYYNWTGFYVGGTVGYGFGDSEWTAAGATVADVSPKGMMYGVTLGYNWQGGSWVYGVEGDYNFASVKGNGPCGGGGIVCETENKWLATFRGRIGYAFDRFMPYFTGGGAYGDIKASISAPILSESNDRFGWTIGGGMEYAFLANWTVKAEYLYVDLGKAQTTTATGVSYSTNIVRGGLNYKF